MVLRKITEKDNQQIACIIRNNLEKYHLDIPGTVYYDPELDCLSAFYLADQKTRAYLILENEGKMLGGVGLAAFDGFEKCAELQKIYLSDDAKGKGLGKMLMQTIEDTARNMGFEKMYLETHTNLQVAISMYEACGYERIQKPEMVQHSTMNVFFIKDL